MRLERASVHRVRWPLANGGQGGAARGHWHERTGAVLVICAEGQRGLGEASPLPGHGADDDAAPRAAGELEAFARTLPLTIDGTRPRESVAALIAQVREPSARFAIETAVLDLLAQAADVSLAALLVDDHPAASEVASARVIDGAGDALAAWSAGFGTLKLKWRPAARTNSDSDSARRSPRDLGRSPRSEPPQPALDSDPAAVRRVVPAARLRLDVNQAWDLRDVDLYLDGLVALGLEYVEEPAQGLAPTLRAPRACALALDESLARADREDWLDRALASGALAALVLKPTVLGGLAACLALAARARAHGVDGVISHALEGPIATAALAELARALAGPRAHGVDVHAGLPAWQVTPSQLVPPRVVAARGPGLGLGS